MYVKVCMFALIHMVISKVKYHVYIHQNMHAFLLLKAIAIFKRSKPHAHMYAQAIWLYIYIYT